MEENFGEPRNDRQAAGGRGSTYNKFDNKGAKIDLEIGVLNGDVHYAVNPSATPEERFEAAIRLLDGNMARRASELIQRAVENGYRTNRVAYYWTLSVLSGRPFERVKLEEYDTLKSCFTMVDPALSDEWLDALDVIKQLMNCLSRQERGSIDDDEYEQVILAYDDLGEKRREEIRRHLDLIMTGAFQDQLDAKYAAEIQRNRMSGDRERRAWKFFEPVPAEPRLETFPEPRFEAGQRAAAAAGAVIGGSGLLFALVLSVPHTPWLALALAAGVGGGGYLLATIGRSWVLAKEQIAVDDQRNGAYSASRAKATARLEGNVVISTAMVDGAAWRANGESTYGVRPGGSAVDDRRRYAMEFSGHEDDDADDGHEFGEDDDKDTERYEKDSKRKFFDVALDQYVDHLFAAQGDPKSLNRRTEWWTDSAAARRALANDLRKRYAGSDITITQLKWLIEWHAKRAKKRWDQGSLRTERAELVAAAPSGGLVFLGVLAVLAGFLCGVIGAFGWGAGYGLIALAAVGVGGWIAYASGFESYVVRCDVHEAESRLASRRHAEEKAEFERWQGELADRPTDAEMARWLDYDKLFIKNDVMRDNSLVNRDLVTHAILTEAEYPTRKARALFGPPRYSDYLVTVILLEETGVRKITKSLNFLNGKPGIFEDGKFFQYDSISSADMINAKLQLEGKGRKVVEADNNDDESEGDTVGGAEKRRMPSASHLPPSASADAGSGQRPVGNSVVFGEALRMYLNNGRHIDFFLENLDQAFLYRARGTGDRETVGYLFKVTMDVSGMEGALRLLRDVATQGGEWIREQRRRRDRRLLDFQRKTGMAALQGRPSRPAGPQLSAPAIREDVVRVPVDGGELVVERVKGPTAPVLAIHGFTSQRRQWNWLRDVWPDLGLVMPDLRGRGESNQVGGPSSIGQHVDDLVAVLDYLGISRVFLCGAATGAAIAVDLAAAYPDRVHGLILIDGGFPTTAGSRLTPEATPAIVRERLLNRDRAWLSPYDYAQFFTQRTSPLLEPADLLLIDFLEHELQDRDGQLVRRLNCERLREDTTSVLWTDTANGLSAPPSWQRVSAPTWLLTAQWGVGPDSPPAYPPPAVEAVRERMGTLFNAKQVAGVDHASIVMSLPGAQAAAETIAQAIS